MKNMKHLSRRGLALLLTLVMCLGMLQITAFASEKTLVCDLEEHTHSDDCYKLVCTEGKEETPEPPEGEEEIPENPEGEEEIPENPEGEEEIPENPEGEEEIPENPEDEEKTLETSEDPVVEEETTETPEVKDETPVVEEKPSEDPVTTGAQDEVPMREESGSAGEHTHGEGCYGLICGKVAHNHGDSCYQQVPTKVTLTYDANAGEDDVTGLPLPQTADSGKQVTIRNYRDMKREGYSILGWSTSPDAVWFDSDLKIGTSYTLNEDTTFYAVWEKLPDEGPEVPDGAKLQEVVITPRFSVSGGGSLQKEPMVRYDYSYEYGGQTYTGRTENEKLMGGLFESNNQVLKVLVDESGGTPTEVKLTLKGEAVEGHSWYAQQFYDSRNGWTVFREKTASVPVNSTLSWITMYNYYTKAVTEPDETVTEREVDIVVAFLMSNHDSFTLDKVSQDYAVTYSYQNVEGETVTEILERKDATTMETERAILDGEDGVTGWDEDKLCYHLKWTITVPVVGDGSYLTLTQSNYDVTESPYVWDYVFGTTERTDAVNIGRLYVSKDNNPVTPYIYNVYTKEYTVTYVDGVEGGGAFANQTYKVKEGAAMPAFNGTPARSGYTFTGWSPAVAETVTGDVTYTAQWRPSEGSSTGGSTPTPTPTPAPDPTPTPAPTPTPDPEEPSVDIPDPDVPLVELPDEDVPLTEIPEEDVPLTEIPEEFEIPEEEVPLANVPRTGDISALWYFTTLLSAGILAFLGLRRKDR